MNTNEIAIRHQLGIPDEATEIIIIEQSAHLDWDWLGTFEQYYKTGCDSHIAVRDSFSAAVVTLTAKNQPLPFYTFCEMAFLQAYLSDSDPKYQTYSSQLKGLTQNIAFSGAGITSAENLLCHGEAFIRNYLLGRKWIGETFNVWSVNQLWLPDDFGHDAQLPIVVQAMGYKGVGFERVPIDCGMPGDSPIPAENLAAPTNMLANNSTFIWVAADGSKIQANWLNKFYCEGNNIIGNYLNQSSFPPTNDIDYEGQSTFYKFFTDHPADSYPYKFVPIDCDFACPYTNLSEAVSNWNQNNPNKQRYVAIGTFDLFMQLTEAYSENNSPLPQVSFSSTHLNRPDNQLSLVTDHVNLVMSPNPYYSGCYTSHPDLKYYHYSATRALLAAEALEVFIEYLAFSYKKSNYWHLQAVVFRQQLEDAWNQLVPSTHHDFITGTASDWIYKIEQIKVLVTAEWAARSALTNVLSSIAKALVTTPADGEYPITVFNPIGIPQAGLVEINPPLNNPWQSIRIGATHYPVQANSDCSLLFIAQSPSFGYSTVYLSTNPLTASTEPGVTCQTNANDTFTLTNEHLTAVINTQGIISLQDVNQNPVLFSTGNQILFYCDSGNIYRLGNELQDGIFQHSPTDFSDASITLIENGPLRITAQVVVTYKFNDQPVVFTRTYSLVTGEPYLRMTTKGTAPSGYSVMVCFPFSDQHQGTPAASLTHGTAYHWETGQPRQMWQATGSNFEQMTFEATHNYVIPQAADGTPLAAIYHVSTPSWAIDTKGNLLGCILRNTPGTQNGAHGSDSSEHLASYAIRIPKGLAKPITGCGSGGPLGESLLYNNPQLGITVPTYNQDYPLLPEQMSLASTDEPTSLITTLKTGTLNQTELVLRVYQPTNTVLSDVKLNIDPALASFFQQNGTLQITGRTALELPLEKALPITPNATDFTFEAAYSLTTLALSNTTTISD